MRSSTNYTAILLLLLALASPIAGADGAPAPAVEVEIINFKFVPQEITVNVGDTVRWTNIEKRQYHSVWFEEAGDPEPPYFFPGESFVRSFDKSGSFPYHCGPHPEMTGVVQVK